MNPYVLIGFFMQPIANNFGTVLPGHSANGIKHRIRFDGDLGAEVSEFGHRLGARLLMIYLPWKLRTEFRPTDGLPFLGSNGFNVRSHVWRYPSSSIAPSPDVPLADRFASPGSQLAGEDRLSANDCDRAIECFGAHDCGIYYQGSDLCNYQCGWTANYRISSFRGMKLSKRLKDLRAAANLSQEEFARKAGVSQQLIAKIEGEKIRESRKLPKIAKAFGLSVEQLLDGISVPAQTPPAVSAELGLKERSLISAYWAASDDARQMIDRMLLGAEPPLNKPPRVRQKVLDEHPKTVTKKSKRRKFE